MSIFILGACGESKKVTTINENMDIKLGEILPEKYVISSKEISENGKKIDFQAEGEIVTLYGEKLFFSNGAMSITDGGLLSANFVYINKHGSETLDIQEKKYLQCKDTMQSLVMKISSDFNEPKKIKTTYETVPHNIPKANIKKYGISRSNGLDDLVEKNGRIVSKNTHVYDYPPLDDTGKIGAYEWKDGSGNNIIITECYSRAEVNEVDQECDNAIPPASGGIWGGIARAEKVNKCPLQYSQEGYSFFEVRIQKSLKNR